MEKCSTAENILELKEKYSIQNTGTAGWMEQKTELVKPENRLIEYNQVEARGKK